VLLLHIYSKEEGSAYIVAGDIRIPVSVADTDEARQKGLSGTPSLKRGTGKLFIFDTPGIYPFWMKDMHYSLDIVWIDSQWKVVDVTVSATPESYPTTFVSSVPVQYVLEVNAYEATVDNFHIGAQLQFQN
jgi:hypothetical protein